MANENWKPGTGKAIPTNTPIKVDSKFNTITSSNPSGYIPFDPNYTGATRPYYAINNDGIVTFKYGPGPSTQSFQADVENTLNDFASRTTGASEGKGVANRTFFQTSLQSTLEAQAPNLGVTPTGTQAAPAGATPAAAPTNTPGAAAAGPNADPAAGGQTVGGLKPFEKGTFGEDKFGSLRYPINMNSSQDRIFITQLQYARTGVVQQESDFSVTKLNAVGYVTLPIPNDISEANQTGWGEDSLSNIAAGLMPGLVGAGAGVAGVDFGQIKNGMEQLSKFLGGNSALSVRANQFLTTKAAAGIVGKLGINVNPEAYISRATGAAINPNLELLFSGPKLRQFGFQFKMTARSKEEAVEIRKIIRFFKKGMAPRRSASNPDASFFLGTPNVFKIKFLSGNTELKSIGKFKTCALVSFTANYTPDGFYAAYNDSAAGGSQPISVTMQMGFNELTPVFSDEYGDTEDDVGPNKFDYKSSGDQTDSTALTDIQTREAYSNTDIAKRIGATSNVTRNLANQFSSSIPELNPFGQYLK